MSSSILRATLITGTVMLMPLASQAESRYDTWSPPGSSASAINTEGLLKDLKALVDEADKARAADRVFLRDLRDLMARYQKSQTGSSTSRLLFDDFNDGNYTASPAWKLVSGEFWVEQGYGLRSKATTGSATSGTSNGKVSKEELVFSILGAVLQGANKNKSNTTTAPAADLSGPAVLSTRLKISNAFAITADLSSWTGEGSFAVAVTQGTSDAGYRVLYTPKQGTRSATLELVRMTSRGQGTINSVSINALEDQKNHTLNWTRDQDGRMVVKLDTKQVLNTRDTTFRDPFDGLVLINAGADVIVKSVEVLGSQ